MRLSPLSGLRRFLLALGFVILLLLALPYALMLVFTFLAGMTMVHIDKPLYFYRRHDRNSFVAANGEVQRQQAANCDRYLHALIREQCRRMNQPMIDLGGGHSCPEGFLSLDVDADLKPNPRAAS